MTANSSCTMAFKLPSGCERETELAARRSSLSIALATARAGWPGKWWSAIARINSSRLVRRRIDFQP